MGRSWMILVMIALMACQKDPSIGPVSSDGQIADTIRGRRLIIGCEGNFQYNNASLTAFAFDADEAQQNVYESANDKPIGDVVQHVQHLGDLLYVVVNNSGLIRIINDSSFQEVGVIEGLTSPRKILLLNEREALVTDLYAGSISRLDLIEQRITKTYTTSEWTEGIAQLNESIFIASMSDSLILMLNSDQQLDTIQQLKVAPQWLIASDKSVFCAGNEGDLGLLMEVGPNGVINQRKLEESIYGFGVFEEWLYVLLDDRVQVYDSTFLPLVNLPHDATTPYAVYVSEDGVFVADVKDFITRGEVLRYGFDLEFKARIETGYIPQSMVAF